MNPDSSELELTGYALCEMLGGKEVKVLCEMLGLRVPEGNRKTVSQELATQISLEQLHEFCVSFWTRPNEALHLNHLQSGMITGFSWHNSTPQSMHYLLQSWARDVAAEKLAIEDFFKRGKELVCKEYLLVAASELTELAIIESCKATPPLRFQALSDLILRGYPFDVKNVSVPKGWTADSIRDNRARFAKSMFLRADARRNRKRAPLAFNGWAYNRLFVCISDENRWLSEPRKLIYEIGTAASALKEPFEFRAENRHVRAHVIVL